MDAPATALPSPARPAPSPPLGGALVLAAAAAFYVPSLGFGYFYDDFWILQEGIGGAHTLLLARPAWYLPSWLAAQASTDVVFQRAVSLACFLAVAAVGYRLLRPHPLGLAILAVLLAHPWFVYPVTWISQRSDLLWIAFVGLALLAATPRATAGWAIASLLAKAPFILHGPVLAWRLFAARAPLAGWAVLAAFAAVGAFAALAVLGPHVLANSDAVGGLHTIKRGTSDPAALAGVFLATGAGKVAESLAMMFVPFPATWGTGALGLAVAAACLAAWGAIGWTIARRGGRGVNGLWIAIGLAASVAFVFLAQLRAIAPAGFFLVAGLLVALPPTRAAKFALGALFAANLASSVALYRATDTGCYDLHRPDAVRECQEPADLPIARWQRDRNEIVQALAARIKARL